MKKTLIAALLAVLTLIACKKETGQTPPTPTLSLLADKVKGVYDMTQIGSGATIIPSPTGNFITLGKATDKSVNMTIVAAGTNNILEGLALTEVESNILFQKTVGSLVVKGTWKADSLIIINELPGTALTYYAKKRL